MAKKFDSISKNNKNINILASIFKDEVDEIIPVIPVIPVTSVTPVISIIPTNVKKSQKNTGSKKTKESLQIVTQKTLETPITSLSNKEEETLRTQRILKTPVTLETPKNQAASNPVEKTLVTQETLVTHITQEISYVRQTIIVSTHDLDLLRNLVYTKRLEGKVNYTQKEALQEVIAYFRLHHKSIKERPQEIRDEEIKRSESIVKGKK
jgi:hypothetical protein